MATTKIWPIKDSLVRVVDYARNPEKTIYSDLRAVLHYAADGEKTVEGVERTMYVTGVNCRWDTAYQEMRAVQERFGKTGGNVAYHAYQSFKPGEVTPEQCHRLGAELAKRMWGDSYQVLVATHFNTGTYHNHFVVNAVGLWDGKKFDCGKKAYYRFRQLSDDLCREYQLSVIEHPKGWTPRSIYFAEKNGEPTKYNLMREALDAAMKVSIDGRDLERCLRDQGYILDANPNHKYATIRRIVDKKAVRLWRLGEDYDIPAINAKIEANRHRYAYDYTFHHYRLQLFQPGERKKCRMKGTMDAALSIGGFRGLFLRYSYTLGVFPKASPHTPLSPEMKEACRRLDSLDRQTRLICWNKLDTVADVQKFIEKKHDEIAALTAARQKCYNRLRRRDDPEEIEAIKRERDGLTKQIAKCRLEVKTAREVLDRHEQMKQQLKLEQQMLAQRQGRQRNKRKERSLDR